MIVVLLLISAAAFVLSLLICMGEIFHERDWPRHTWCYPVIFGVSTLLLLCAI